MAAKPKWWKLLKPYEELFWPMRQEVYNRVELLNEQETNELLQATHQISSSNCSWGMHYMASEHVRDACQGRLRVLKEAEGD